MSNNQHLAQDEREAFEAWATAHGVACTKAPQALMFANGRRVPAGGYILAETALAWKSWQARATRSVQTAPQPSPDALINGAKALLALDESGSLVPHGIGGLAREVIEKLIVRVEQTAPRGETK